MPKVRLLAPWTNSKGEPQASGAVIDVSDDEAKDLSARGQASLVEEEKKLEEQQATSAVYDARLQRPDAPGAPAPDVGQESRSGSEKPPEQEPPSTSTRKK